MRQLKVKSGMGGSNGGRNRTMKTGILKKVSKKARRKESKHSVKNE